MKRNLTLLILLLSVWGVRAQQRVGVAWYDLGGLYDPEPSLFADDADYQADGPLGWSEERYADAVARYASLIDSMAMPLVGLFGVENERVALDLAARSEGDYSVLHETSNRLDGLDFALLYQADRFLPERSEMGYGRMLVEGELDGCAVSLLLVRDDRFLAEEVERLQSIRPRRPLLIMGHIEDLDPRYGLQDALSKAEERGYGNSFRRGGWRMRDRLWVDPFWQVIRAGVYVERRLLDEQSGKPLPLYERGRYRGGWSENLPVFVYLLPEDLEN